MTFPRVHWIWIAAGLAVVLPAPGFAKTRLEVIEEKRREAEGKPKERYEKSPKLEKKESSKQESSKSRSSSSDSRNSKSSKSSKSRDRDDDNKDRDRGDYDRDDDNYRRYYRGGYGNSYRYPYRGGYGGYGGYYPSYRRYSGSVGVFSSPVYGSPSVYPAYRGTTAYPSPGSGADLVATVQQSLTAHGFSAGYADGVMGPRTRGAIDAFRRSRGMAPGPVIDDALLYELGIYP